MSGSVKVVSEGLPIGGGLRYNLPAIGEAVVGAGPPVGDALFPVRRQEGGITTGVAIHNLGEEAMEARCELMREGVLRDFVSISLEANGQTSWMIDQAFPAADTSDFTGSVRCAAPGRGRFTAIAVEMDAAERIFTTLSVVPLDRTGGGNKQTTLNFAHFVNGTWITDLVFVNLSSEASRPAPTPFHTAILPSRPAYLFLRHRGQPDCRRIGGGHHGRPGDHRGRRSDGPHRDGAAGSTHDLDPRARGAGVGIGAGGLGGSHRRDAPL